MKHVTPNETEQLLDLGKPSLEALSFMLRHREMWPKRFKWVYDNCDKCAMGLAHQLWCITTVSEAFNMPIEAARNIFLNACDRRQIHVDDVTPEMIADDIDAYLTDLKSI